MTTRKSKPRLKYKALYFAAQHDARVQACRASLLAQKVRRIQRAIAPRAEAILNAHRLDSPQIALDAHDYVCVEAQFELNQCFGAEPDMAGWTAFSYKETPIVEKPL